MNFPVDPSMGGTLLMGNTRRLYLRRLPLRHLWHRGLLSQWSLFLSVRGSPRSMPRSFPCFPERTYGPCLLGSTFVRMMPSSETDMAVLCIAVVVLTNRLAALGCVGGDSSAFTPRRAHRFRSCRGRSCSPSCVGRRCNHVYRHCYGRRYRDDLRPGGLPLVGIMGWSSHG